MSVAQLPQAIDGGDLLASYLSEQQSLTAVERFAQMHGEVTEPLQARYYRDLLPLSKPQPGEQYAFEVDLDACSGCKGCVTACHRLNGLEEGEMWRDVGLLQGGTPHAPHLQHVTTACHHCLKPACLEGCPVAAYEKDPATGIVRHLDDQCIGCQYCILKCPYDVPKYSRTKGIVRKCDMCHGRLAQGEAPACVQACPSEAIRIRIVRRQQVIEDSEANLFLVGAPEPGYTLPTTLYKSERPLPRNLLPADYYTSRPQHAHWPLVWMLVLTQLSVGGFATAQVVDRGAAASMAQVTTSFVFGLLGLVASIFHLGRPLYAFRAFLGLGTSWLSREILAFGLFAGAASAYTVAALMSADAWSRALGMTTSFIGLAAVMCSVMIYVDTRRAYWTFTATALRFLLTVVVLGIPLSLLTQPAHSTLWLALLAATATKLASEATIFWHLREPRHTPLKRTAILLVGDLARPTFARFALSLAGGVVIPCLKMIAPALRQPTPALVLACLALLLLAVGEVCERYLFFAAVVAPKMPGSPAS